MERPPLPRDDKPLFFARFEVGSHVSKKNSRPILRNSRTNRPFLGKGKALTQAEQLMMLNIERSKCNTSVPTSDDIHACFRFYFDDFYTKDVRRRKNLPDLSNLVELPQDILQKCGVIENDSQIVSLDGSRRLPGPQNIIEIWIWKANS